MALIRSKKSVETDAQEEAHPRDCLAVLASLSDENPETRRWAARDVLTCEGACQALIERLKVEEQLSVREVILTSLIRLDSPDSMAGLVDCLRSEDAALRNEALEAMKQLPDLVAPLMQGLLKDADPDVRIFAVNILESLRHPHVEAWLIDVITSDEHINVCATALDLLSEVGSAGALPAIHAIKIRFSDEPYIQFAADVALKRISES